MSTLLPLSAVEIRRDVGIERAVNRADRACPFWSDEAYEHLLDFCMLLKLPEAKEFGLSHRTSFLAETVRDFAEKRGLVPPPDERSWGAVMRRAARNNLIRRIGYAPARSSNLSPKCLWVAA